MSDNLRNSGTMQVVLRTGLLGLVLTLGGCASTPEYSPQDVEIAAAQGQLESMFDQVKADLANAKPGSEKAMGLDATLDNIAVRLAKPHQATIDELMAEARKRPLSLEEIGRLEAEVATVRQWLPYDRPELRYEVESVREQTEDEITRAELALGELTPEQGGERYLLEMELAVLIGGEEGAALQATAEQDLESLYRQGVDAVENKQLSNARLMLNQVAVADPQYRELVYYQELVATGLFEQHFWQALVDGRTDEAFTLFYEFAETPAFATHRNKVSKDAAELAEYFDALGDKQRKQRQWLDSYRAFRKAVYIRDKLEMPVQPSTGMQRFTLEMENRFKRAEKAGNTSAALAYLSIIDSIYPQHALLEREQRSSYEAVFDQAVVKVSIESFAGTYGRQMASGISRYLLANVPNEVRMVSRDQFEVVDNRESQSAAYFIVDGEMLRTDVEKREQPRTEKRSVATRTEPGPNPAYKAWKGLPRSERKLTPEPPEEVDLPVYEEAVVKHRDITNKAVLSVSYKVIDPVSAKVLFVETVSDSLSAEATATQGMVKGDFVLEAEPALLPAEAEMFEELIGSVSEHIGAELASSLLALESRYEGAARDEAEQNNYSAAVDQWAYAYVVSDPDSEARANYRLEMEETVLLN